MVKARLAVAAVQPHADAGTTAKRKYDENAQQAWPIGHRGRGARHTAGGALGQEKSFKQQLIGTWSLMSPEEAKALGIGTLAYYGTDTVNERDQTITEKLRSDRIRVEAREVALQHCRQSAPRTRSMSGSASRGAVRPRQATCPSGRTSTSGAS